MINKYNTIPISEASFLDPEYIPPASAWLEHAPFAFWLINTMRPKVLVELGTHYGFSYFTFCQAIKKWNSGTTSYAIDTWQGDEHAGFYDEYVYKMVLKENEKYNLFSNLIKSTFDEAVTRFEDNSIDLIHFDGRHLYEDIKHDFTTWFPKLAENAIALFHDTNEYNNGFGVWEYFEELSIKFQTFNFKHGHGLGIVVLGNKYLEILNVLKEKEDLTRQVYFLLGNRNTFIKNMAERDAKIASLKQAVVERDAKITGLRNELDAIQRSKTWRIGKKLAKAFRSVFPNNSKRYLVLKIILKPVLRGITKRMMKESILKVVNIFTKKRNIICENNINDDNEVALSVFNSQQLESKPEDIIKEIESFEKRPVISIIMPVYNTQPQWLILAIQSVINQIYPYWELCIVDDGSKNNDTVEVLGKYTNIDSRIKIKHSSSNQGISSASNMALELSSGEFIGLLDHDDELTYDALYWVVKRINQEQFVDFIYSDECKINDTNERLLYDFHFKPDWSPEYMLNFMYTGHFSIYRRSIVMELKGFDSKYDFSQDYDLALRVSRRTKNIHHIERVLYFWRAINGSAAKVGGKDFARISNLRALGQHIFQQELDAYIIPTPIANYVRIKSKINTKVSIIIPSDNYANLVAAINGILKMTTYSNFEIIVVCNSDLAIDIRNNYLYLNNLILVVFDKKFNFSEKCNEGTKFANGEIVVFYNDDIVPLQSDWLEKLIEYLDIPGVGAISPKLLYENGSIQYAGMFCGGPGFVGTIMHGYTSEKKAYSQPLDRLVRNVTVLSGACCAIKTSVFWDIGGFDAINTPNGHSDVDLSFRIQEAGLRCVYTPYSTLLHTGNHTWHPRINEKDKSDIYLMERWGSYLLKDRYFTSSMKKIFYKDFIHSFKIYADKKNITNKKSNSDVLLVSHEMTRTGAVIMLSHATSSLLKSGHRCTIISPSDGPMREHFNKLGAFVIIDEMVFRRYWLTERFMKNFDFILANTIVSLPVLIQMKIYNLPSLLWIHESKYIDEYVKSNPKLRNELSSIKNVIISSNYAKRFAKDYFDAISVLYNGIPDYISTINENLYKENDNKILIILVGTIEKRKGQDIFIEAIEKMHDSIRRKCEFMLVGAMLDGNKEYVDRICNIAKKYPEIKIINGKVHEEIIEIIAGCSILVCPSRDESFSLTVLEAISLRKPVIISDAVGVKDYLVHNESAFIFPSGDSDSLKFYLEKLVVDSELRRVMGIEGRKIYEKKFTIREFEENFLRLFNQIILNNGGINEF